jgi:hypothetical protein
MAAMAAILKKLRCLFSAGMLHLIDQILPVNFKCVRQCIQKLLNRNEIQEGCCGGHIEKAAKLIFKGNSPLDRQNTLCQFERNQTRHSKVIKRNQNSRWLLWWTY